MERISKHAPYLAGFLAVPEPHLQQQDHSLSSETEEVARSVRTARWSLPPGGELRQLLLVNPGCVVMFRKDGTRLFGPMRRAQTTSYSKSGWSLTVRFRPAATAVLTGIPVSRLVDRSMPCRDSPAEAVRTIMNSADSALWAEELSEVLDTWLRWLEEQLDDDGLLANRIYRTIETDAEIRTVSALAERFRLSPRSLQRLLVRYTGLTPHTLIERRRLQAAVTTLESGDDISFAALAHDLGFSDQAHFIHRFRRVFGMTPGKFRDRFRS